MNDTLDQPVAVVDGQERLEGSLRVPVQARAVVVFAHGSGSGRASPRNRLVAGALERVGIATLLFDLLTAAEQARRASSFDVALLARRLRLAVDEVRRQDGLAVRPLGLYGASTGAAAAVAVAADPGAGVAAVVSRGGRPDLAYTMLGRVRAPTLLIVGGRDATVLELNRGCIPLLAGPAELAVVPEATHLFEEPGALEVVARLATQWFERHLAGPA